MGRPLFFYSDALMDYAMGPQHPLKPIRLRMTRDLLESYEVFGLGLELCEPALASEADLLATHSPEYLAEIRRLENGVRSPETGRFGFGSGDNPIFPHMYEASLRYTGGSLDAAQAILDGAGGGQVAFNISGGLHHAHYDRAAGFCVLNDCAAAICRLRQKFTRVAYVDIDVHHGDGVQESFYDDPTVLTVSIHQNGRTLFPGTGFTDEIGVGAGEGYSVNIPLAPYTQDAIWLDAWRKAGLPLLKAFRPEAILLQMGADPHFRDPLAQVCLTAQGWVEAVRDVRSLDVPIVAVGGGGYNLTTVPRMWTLAVAALAELDIADTVPDSYPHQTSIPRLTDESDPDVPDRYRDAATAYASQTVDSLRRLFSLPRPRTEEETP